MHLVKIATFNVNSVRARLPRVLEWLEASQPDVACLQEIKCVDDVFPALEFQSMGYQVSVHGQKTYNGVAILSKSEPSDVTPRLPGDDGDEQARYLEATIDGVRIASIYLPNGNPLGGEKFAYKLGWMERLYERAKLLLNSEMPVVLCGDFNVCPRDEDCYDPAAFTGDALCQPESRAALRRLEFLGYTDAFRQLKPSGQDYTFWDYQRGAWQKDNGLRIDHFYLSPQAIDRLQACEVERGERAKERASDHTPIWCRLDV
jgi:exodeoxyribonuclease-3